MRLRPFLPLSACLSLFLLSTPALAQEAAGPAPGDAAAYLQTVARLKNEPVEKQAEILREFLEAHPDSSFRPEAEANLKRLEELLVRTDPVRKKEARDTRLYLRAVEYAKKLGPHDRVALWEQFLRENPDSLYRTEAETRLAELRAKYGEEARPVPPEAPAPGALPVARAKPPKNRNTALLLAAFPGVLVPGIGHWYARDYVTAGVLTGARAGALALGIPGVVNGNAALIIVGSVVYLFSYGLDVIRAPYAVDRYNDALEAAGKAPTSGFRPGDLPAPGLALTFSVPF